MRKGEQQRTGLTATSAMGTRLGGTADAQDGSSSGGPADRVARRRSQG